MAWLIVWVGSKVCDPGPWPPVPSIPGAIISSRNHGPWAARIELRISAFFFFLNPTISQIQGPVKLESLPPSLKACGLTFGPASGPWSMHALTSLYKLMFSV